MASSPVTYAYSPHPLPFHWTFHPESVPEDANSLTSPDGLKTARRSDGDPNNYDDDKYVIANNATGESIVLAINSTIDGPLYKNIAFSSDSKCFFFLERYVDDNFASNRLFRVDVGAMSELELIKYFEGININVGVARDNKSFVLTFSNSPPGESVVLICLAGNTDSGALFDPNTSSSNVAGNGRISEAHVVEGGKFVAFVSTSSNLVAGDTNGVADVFLKDLQTGAVTRVSTSASGGQANAASAGLDVSPDGTKLIFHSKADNLVAGDANRFSDVFVKDIATGAVTLVSTTGSGAAGNGDSTDGQFSPDGRSIAFRSTAANLVPNDINGGLDVFLKTLGTGAVTPLSFLDDGSFLSVPVTGKPAFSRDGGTVSFGTYSYALDSTGLLVLNVSFPRSQTGNVTATVSKGDGSPATTYAGNDYGVTVGLDYDRDGDFQAAVNGQSFTVKVRAHSGAQTFVGNGGSETVLLSSGNDKADGGAGNDTLVGNAGRDDLSGGAGNDMLDGGRGADTLRGGLGDDRYYVDEVGDTVVEAAGAGRDTVVASVSMTLGANVEDLVLTGTASLTGTGNGLANVITGNAGSNVLSGLDGDDILDGAGGSDRMIGGSGNDTYYLSAKSDIVEEQSNGGIDTIYAYFSTTLVANIENLVLIDDSGYSTYISIDGNGNASDNRITGSAGNNRLDGREGNDILIGNGGDDTLQGGAGINRLVGGMGSDTYYVSSSSDQVDLTGILNRAN